MSSQTPVAVSTTPQPRKPISKWWWIGLLIACVVFFAIGGGLIGADTGADTVPCSDGSYGACYQGDQLDYGAFACFAIGGILHLAFWTVLVIWLMQRHRSRAPIVYGTQPTYHLPYQFAPQTTPHLAPIHHLKKNTTVASLENWTVRRFCGNCGAATDTPFCKRCGFRALTAENINVNHSHETAGGLRPTETRVSSGSIQTREGFAATSPSGDIAITGHDGASGSASQTTGQQPSCTSHSFRSLIERSIAAWNNLTYVGDPDVKDSVTLLSATLRGFGSIEDLLQSKIMFWFFQCREPFMKQKQFLKWDPSSLDEYVLLPASEGYVNKKDCFYVSHFWRTKEHPDPQGEDFRLVRGDLANQTWSYVWIDWTCLPQNASSEKETEYSRRMLQRTPTIMRDCAFAWRYPDFQPRLWILLEVAEYMLSVHSADDIVSMPDIKPFMDDVRAMQSEGVLQQLQRRGYQCSNAREYRLLVGWLELLVIFSKLVPNVIQRRFFLDSVEPSHISIWKEYDTGIEVNKVTGIVYHNNSVHQFAPLWPLGNDRLPAELAELN